MLRFFLTLLLFAPFSLQASSLSLPSLFGDHMVVQHDQPVRVWGMAEPGAGVEVALHESKASTTADAGGYWRLELPAPPAGGPYRMEVKSGAEELVFEDVLSGEVWIASGQSNMEWSVASSSDKNANLAAADLERLRLFEAPRRIAHKPLDDNGGTWKVSSKESAADFSAVAWHFGRKLLAETDVPVGMIQAAWGGTYVQAWTPYEVLETFEFMAPALDKYRKAREHNETVALPGEAKLREALETNRKLEDPGNRGVLLGWQLAHYDDGDWEDFPLPGKLEDVAPGTDGAFWVRREVELPESWAGRELKLSLGPIDDFDVTYFNGIEVGSTGPEVAAAYREERSYVVPGELVEAGTNVIAVRVFDRYRDGGFTGDAGELYLEIQDSSEAERIALAGDWTYRFEVRAEDPHGSEVLTRLRPTPNQPAVLFKGMIEPILPYALRGAIWYQGESNSGQPERYAQLFPAMIEAWRQAWQLGDFPFYYVQLANFKELQKEPSEGGWAEIREAQQAALELPNTGEVVTLDVGEADDVHPRDKQTPGERLAALALAEVYGQDLPHQSPYLEALERRGNQLWLRFAPVYDGLQTRDGEPPRGFAIRGEQGDWYWADVEIVGNDTVVLSHPDIPEPVAARYGWASNPVGNLVNSAGFPMSGFRTE